jgi:hypothetical protein
VRGAGILFALGVVLAVSACDPFSKRPRLEPLPLAPVAELKGKRPDVSEKTIARLREDSLPLAHVTVKDAYAESPWLDSASMQPTTRRPLGTDVVKFRTWVDPSKPGYSRITIEPVYRVSADPSVPERELDRLVPEGHPARKWAETFFAQMGAKPVEVIPVGPTTKRSGAMPTSGQGGILRTPSGLNNQ